MDPEPNPRPTVAPSQIVGDVVHHPEETQTIHLGSGDNIPARPVSNRTSSSADQQQPLIRISPDTEHPLPPPPENPFEPARAPSASRSRNGHGRGSSRYQHAVPTIAPPLHPRSASQLDWIVPVEEKGHKRRTVGERLQPTVENAEREKQKYELKASWTGYALNIAIALQVFLGALTTGIAAGVKDARDAQVSTAVLGGLSTIVASYLARARGSGEPEFSTRRVKDLEHFLRDCRAFQIDHAHEYAVPGDRLDHRVEGLRRRLEEMLGNVTDIGDKKTPAGSNQAFDQRAIP